MFSHLPDANTDKDVDLSTYVEQTDPPDVLYNEGLANLNAGRMGEAAKKFTAVDREHPYTEYRAQIDRHAGLHQLPQRQLRRCRLRRRSAT